jgi:hypothetical protein
LVSNAAIGWGIGWNQAGWSFGFAVVGLTAGIGGEESAPMVGQEGVREVQIDLASVGRITEQGWVAYPAESRFLNPGVQIDLLDLTTGDMYDAKKGPSGGGAGIQVELERQKSIVGQTVELRNTITGKVIPEFLIKSNTWVGVANRFGKFGFNASVKGSLNAYQTSWMYFLP